MTDMREAHAAGHASRAVHYNSIFDVLEDERTGHILKSLIAATAAPLKAVEENFAIDSTGFSGCKFDRWYDEKWGEPRSEAVVGEIARNGRHQDRHHYRPGSGRKEQCRLPHVCSRLMNQTAQQFKIKDFCADMGYLSECNLQAITDLGATPLIPFKSNSAPKRPGVWNKCYHWFNLHREEFLARYHQRSNVESVFSAIKRLFGDSVAVAKQKCRCGTKRWQNVSATTFAFCFTRFTNSESN